MIRDSCHRSNLGDCSLCTTIATDNQCCATCSSKGLISRCKRKRDYPSIFCLQHTILHEQSYNEYKRLSKELSQYWIGKIENIPDLASSKAIPFIEMVSTREYFLTILINFVPELKKIINLRENHTETFYSYCKIEENLIHNKITAKLTLLFEVLEPIYNDWKRQLSLEKAQFRVESSKLKSDSPSPKMIESPTSKTGKSDIQSRPTSPRAEEPQCFRLEKDSIWYCLQGHEKQLKLPDTILSQIDDLINLIIVAFSPANELSLDPLSIKRLPVETVKIVIGYLIAFIYLDQTGLIPSKDIDVSNFGLMVPYFLQLSTVTDLISQIIKSSKQLQLPPLLINRLMSKTLYQVILWELTCRRLFGTNGVNLKNAKIEYFIYQGDLHVSLTLANGKQSEVVYPNTKPVVDQLVGYGRKLTSDDPGYYSKLLNSYFRQVLGLILIDSHFDKQIDISEQLKDLGFELLTGYISELTNQGVCKEQITGFATPIIGYYTLIYAAVADILDNVLSKTSRQTKKAIAARFPSDSGISSIISDFLNDS